MTIELPFTDTVWGGLLLILVRAKIWGWSFIETRSTKVSRTVFLKVLNQHNITLQRIITFFCWRHVAKSEADTPKQTCLTGPFPENGFVWKSRSRISMFTFSIDSCLTEIEIHISTDALMCFRNQEEQVGVTLTFIVVNLHWSPQWKVR